MRAILVLAILASLGWGAYWFAGSYALDRAVTEVMDQSPELSADAHSIRGFPSRFDVTLTNPQFAANGLEWRAPFAQIFALSYRLNHIIAVFANDQNLRVGGTDMTLHSEDLRASVEMEAGLDLPLEQVTLVGTGLDLGIAGHSHRAQDLRAAARRMPEQHNLYEIALVLDTVLPSVALLEHLDRSDFWPRRLDVVRLDAELELSRALDRHALQGAAPEVTQIAFTGGQIHWPGTQIDADGRVSPDANGVLNGGGTLRVTGWRNLLDRLIRVGAIPADQAPLIAIMAQGLTSAENPEQVTVELSIQDGTVRLGPLALMQIPPVF